jgi:hypothetical protein
MASADGHCGDFPGRSFPGGFAEIIRNPREIQGERVEQKKIRGSALFRGRKALQNAGPRPFEPAKTAPKAVKTVAKNIETERSVRVPPGLLC